MTKKDVNFDEEIAGLIDPKNKTTNNKTSKKIDNEKKIEAKKKDTKSNIKFKIPKKEVSSKTSFPLYIKNDLLERLDKSIKNTGNSRNEVINQMIEFCLDNLE